MSSNISADEMLARTEAALKESKEEIVELRNKSEAEKAALERRITKANMVKARFQRAFTELQDAEVKNKEERKNLNEVLSGLEGKVQDLKTVEAKLKNSLESAGEKTERQACAIDELKAENLRFEEKIEGLRRANETYDAENVELKGAKESLEELAKSLRTQIKECDGNNSRLRKTQSVLVEENADLKKRFEEDEARSSQSQILIEDLEQDLLDVREAKNFQQEQLTAEHEAQRKLDQDLRTERRRHAATKADLEYANAQMADSLETETSGFTNVKRILEKQIATLKTKVEQLEAEVDDHQEENRKLKSDVDNLKVAQSSLERQSSRSKGDVENINRKFVQAQERVSVADSNLRKMEDKNEDLRHHLAEEKRHNIELASNVESERLKAARLSGKFELLRETSDTKVAELEQKITTLTSTIDELEEEAKTSSSEASQLEESLRSVQLQNQRCLRDLDHSRRELEEEAARVELLKQREREFDPDRLREQLDKEKADHIASISHLGAELNDEKAKYASIISGLEEDFERHDADLQACVAKATDLQSQVQSWAQAFSLEEENHSRTKTDLEKRDADLHARSLEAADLQSQLNSRSQALKDEEQDHSNTKTQLALAKSDATKLENKYNDELKRVNALNNSLNQTNSTVSSLHSSLNQANSTINSLRASSSHTNCVDRTCAQECTRLFLVLYRAYHRGQSWGYSRVPKGLTAGSNGEKMHINWQYPDEYSEDPRLNRYFPKNSLYEGPIQGCALN